MKIIITLFLLALLTISCSTKEEVKFEAFSAEAFAYDIGDSWEVNATVNVKGFERREAGQDLSASISFDVDLAGPDSIEIKNIYSDSIEVTSKEIIDIKLEAQFELDYNYPDGIYKIAFNVKDNYSGDNTSAIAEFELKK
jgi:hypothetical protein